MGQRRTIYLCAFLLGLFLFFSVIYLRIIWNAYSDPAPGDPPPFGDFFPLWTYVKIATENPVTELYDMATLHARQVALGMNPGAINPFPYPPMAMFLFWPFRWLSYDDAYLCWIIGSLALFVWVVRSTCSGSAAGLLYAVVAPASVGNIFMGQSGFVSAALMTAGLRLAATRPVVSGILIGCMCYKPQLAFLVPIALAAAGLWTAFLTAGVTVIVLAIAATFAFGADIWPAWLAMLPGYNNLFDGASGLHFMPLVVANLRMIGVPLGLAKLGQAIAAITVAIIVARCFKRNAGALATAALLVGVFLVTPHAFFYDLPMTTAAIILFIQVRRETTRRFTSFEVGVLVFAAMFPILMLLKHFPIPLSTVALALLFGIIVREHGRASNFSRPALT